MAPLGDTCSSLLRRRLLQLETLSAISGSLTYLTIHTTDRYTRVPLAYSDYACEPINTALKRTTSASKASNTPCENVSKLSRLHSNDCFEAAMQECA